VGPTCHHRWRSLHTLTLTRRRPHPFAAVRAREPPLAASGHHVRAQASPPALRCSSRSPLAAAPLPRANLTRARCRSPELGFGRLPQFRSGAAVQSRRRPSKGAQGTGLLPQQLLVVNPSRCGMDLGHPPLPLPCSSVPVHCSLGHLILFFTFELQCLKSSILWS
jgi:hypothetical protein